MAILPANIELISFCLGILSQSAKYGEYEIYTYGNKDESIHLDYLKNQFGGTIKTDNSTRLKWSITDEELDKLVGFLNKHLPQCEGRNKFRKWARKYYNDL